MFRSATFKLTMWYLAIVMVISLGFSFIVYHFATVELSTGLHHQTQRIFNEFPVFNGNPDLVRRQGNDVAAGERNILWRLAYFNLLVLVGAGVAGYFLARRTLEPIEAAHEQQKRFTADVSHELRTPLTSLKMSSEVALMDKNAGKQVLRETLESNLEDASKMELLINSLLRLTRLDTSQAEAAFEAVNLQEVVTQAQQQVKKLAAAKQITVSEHLSSRKLTVNGDFDALVQLAVIFLDNAIKYSPEGSNVEIACSKLKDAAQITVADHGQGIKPAALPHIFERFFREDAARSTTQAEGFGLGLSIAKLIADKHGGNITIASRPGKGTTVTTLLPLAAQPTGSPD